MTVSQRLFSVMAQKGITQEQLAKGTGISSRTISDWKNKGTNPQVDKVYSICDFIGVSTDWLLSGEETSTGAISAFDALSGNDQRLVEHYHNADEGTRRSVDKLLDL